jgi:glutathione-independent formaldehyde dehydrogenase
LTLPCFCGLIAKDPRDLGVAQQENGMASNRGVVYLGPGKVEVQSIDYPKLEMGSRKCEHGVILKIVSTNICGSDQHMVRGRTTAPAGLVLGHEITGEIIEKGRDVEFLKVGDVVSVPFNIACGRCRNCKEGRTGICLNVNPSRPGAASAMWIWAAGLGDRPSMSWRRMPTSTC